MRCPDCGKLRHEGPCKPEKCDRCEAEDISPVVEAFEISGQIVCEDCAEEVFEENGQFGVGA